jgi:hypothetical protein
VLFNPESPDFVDHRILKVRAGMAGQIFILQPWIAGSVKKSVDLIHHATKGMPANPSFHPFPIEPSQISHLMPKIAFTLLLYNPHLDTIWSFHLPGIPADGSLSFPSKSISLILLKLYFITTHLIVYDLQGS